MLRQTVPGASGGNREGKRRQVEDKLDQICYVVLILRRGKVTASDICVGVIS